MPIQFIVFSIKVWCNYEILGSESRGKKSEEATPPSVCEDIEGEISPRFVLNPFVPTVSQSLSHQKVSNS